MTTAMVALTPTSPFHTTDGTTSTKSHYWVSPYAMEQRPRPRKEVQNAIRALRKMPPYARQREIDRGRYSNFSPEERELLRSVDR